MISECYLKCVVFFRIFLASFWTSDELKQHENDQFSFFWPHSSSKVVPKFFLSKFEISIEYSGPSSHDLWLITCCSVLQKGVWYFFQNFLAIILHFKYIGMARNQLLIFKTNSEIFHITWVFTDDCISSMVFGPSFWSSKTSATFYSNFQKSMNRLYRYSRLSFDTRFRAITMLMESLCVRMRGACAPR